MFTTGFWFVVFCVAYLFCWAAFTGRVVQAPHLTGRQMGGFVLGGFFALPVFLAAYLIYPIEDEVE